METNFWIGLVFILSEVTNTITLGILNDDILERFLYTQKSRNLKFNGENQLEFLVIGKKVPWHEAEVYCPSYEVQKSNKPASQINVEPEVRMAFDLTSNDINKNQNDGSKLAIVDNVDMSNWLARMLSESNYQYDGLWIGGYRKNSTANWTWVGERSDEDSVIPESILLQNFPSWFEILKQGQVEKNCLLFNRLGHDVPILLPENCYFRRPFICVRLARKRETHSVEQVASIPVDGYQYTLYQVINEDNTNYSEQEQIKKLNGGGITWRNARLECRKRGQKLAMILTNEAASAIAKIMLKSRPSMESAWLGGWSLDGSKWSWVPSGSSISSTKSSSTSYPPWLEGRPIIYENKYEDESLESKSRCLVLDRHICPENIRPVFLDLDCDKERPFVCQDDAVELRGIFYDQEREITLNNQKLQFSSEKMNWNDGDMHCKSNHGHIASIYNSKILSNVLNKMMELSLDHIWIGGHTKKFGNEWKWVDEKENLLSRKGVGITNSWCFPSDKNGLLLQADPQTCLNLDRESNGLPLFYGLPCNTIEQHVLCNIPINSKKNVSMKNEKTHPYLNEPDGDNKDRNLEIGSRFLIPELTEDTIKSRLNFQTVTNKSSDEEKSENATILYNNQDIATNSTLSNVPYTGENYSNYLGTRETTTGNIIETSLLEKKSDSQTEKQKSVTQKASEVPSFIPDNNTKNGNDTITFKNGIKIAELDDETKNLLRASGYNFTDSDLIFGLELEFVIMDENNTVIPATISY